MPAEKRNIRSDFYKQRLSAANQPAAFIGGGLSGPAVCRYAASAALCFFFRLPPLKNQKFSGMMTENRFVGGFMTIPEMLGQSGILTVLGMCVVFSFLIILICFMKIVAFLVKAFGWDKEEAEDTPAAAPAAGTAQDTAVVAAIAAAVKDKT